VESLILLPMTTMSGVPMGPITQGALNIMSSPQTVLLQKLNTIDGNSAFNNGEDSEVINLEAKAAAIDAYFSKRDMPLAGYGKKMVIEAEKNGLDWRLLAAISVRESTGGKFACKTKTHNAFGWGSCKIGFSSTDVAIETIGRNLGGNNPKTAHHYDNKTTLQILRAYNPPSIVPKYGEQVISIMDTISDINLGLKTTKSTEA